MPNKKKEVKKYDQYKKALLEIKDQVVGDLKVMKDESSNLNGNGAGDVSGHQPPGDARRPRRHRSHGQT